MNCLNHPEKEASVLCNRCGKNICPECQIKVKEEFYCKECASAKISGEVKISRSPVLAAILSFVIGGLGQIYNGQVGKGLIIFLTSWLIIPWIIGIFDAYNTAAKINDGKVTVKKNTGCLIAAIAGMILFFIGIAIIGLLLAIAIPNFMRARLDVNNNNAKDTVMVLYKSADNFAASHEGKYPQSMDELLSASPADFRGSYLNLEKTGPHIYIFTSDDKGYQITAKPKECGIAASKIYTIDNTGSLSSDDCK